LDATRRADGLVVGLKYIPDPIRAARELEIITYLSQPNLRVDGRNHCIPVLDCFPHPDQGIFIVMPWLQNFIETPLFGVSDVVDMLDQLLEVGANP
jgi:serine/threonine protein kinase